MIDSKTMPNGRAIMLSWFSDQPLRIHRIDPRAFVPRYHSDGASGLDLHALDIVSTHRTARGRARYAVPRRRGDGRGDGRDRARGRRHR